MNTANLEILSAKQMKKADMLAVEKSKIKSFELMDNAGKAVAAIVAKEFKCGKVLILCGPGNNGGDGLVLSNCLNEHGKEVDLYCLGKNNYKGDALKAYKKNKLKKKPIGELNINQDAVIVDAIFGIGLNKKLIIYMSVILTLTSIFFFSIV